MSYEKHHALLRKRWENYKDVVNSKSFQYLNLELGQYSCLLAKSLEYCLKQHISLVDNFEKHENKSTFQNALSIILIRTQRQNIFSCDGQTCGNGMKADNYTFPCRLKDLVYG